MEFAATIIILTCTYALLAAGIVILYKAGRIVNFAHGELAIVGGYVFYSAGLMSGEMSLWLAIAGAVVFSAVMGVFIHMAMMRRLVGEPFYVAILVTVGIGIVLKSAILVIWRAERLTIDIGVAPAVRLAGGATLSPTWISPASFSQFRFSPVSISSFVSRASAFSFVARPKMRCSQASAGWT